MKKTGVAEAWVPDDETDQVMLGAGAKYQGSKMMAALKYVKNYRTAIDIGAHCGLWSVQLAQHFKRVECFEPLERHIECWIANCQGNPRCGLWRIALGDTTGIVNMKIIPTQSGRSHVHPDGDVTVPINRLDAFLFPDVDLIKLDVEGYELNVIKGAESTLIECKPVIIVEQKPGNGSRFNESDKAALDYLKTLGWAVKEEIAGDFIMVRE